MKTHAETVAPADLAAFLKTLTPADFLENPFSQDESLVRIVLSKFSDISWLTELLRRPQQLHYFAPYLLLKVRVFHPAAGEPGFLLADVPVVFVQTEKKFALATVEWIRRFRTAHPLPIATWPAEKVRDYYLELVKLRPAADFPGFQIRGMEKEGPLEYKVRFVHPLEAKPLELVDRIRFEASGAIASSSHPIRPYTNDDVIGLVARGDPEANRFLTPGDESMVTRLEPYLKSTNWGVAESALRVLIAVRVPAAAKRMVSYAKERELENVQHRALAIHGFLEYHPPEIRQDLFDLIFHERITKSEFSEREQADLVEAIGLMDSSGDLPRLREVERRLNRPAGDRKFFEQSTEFAFLATYARLGDESAARTLGRLLVSHPNLLSNVRWKIGYCKNRVVAEELTHLFSNEGLGSRVGPHADFAERPRDQKEEKDREEMEKNAYVRVKDDALFAIVQILKGEEFGIDPLRPRKYTAEEFEKVRKALKP
ncbi:MAG: hypothetical protein V1798_10275 [Pseudomonadota bacterium]